MKNLFITAIVFYVLYVVLYLLRERMKYSKNNKQEGLHKFENEALENDIIGKSTFDLCHSLPQAANEESREKWIENQYIFVPPNEEKPSEKNSDSEQEETFLDTDDDNEAMDISIPLEYENDEEVFFEEEEEDSWLPGNVMLADGSTFEEMDAAVRTVIHHDAAGKKEKEQAGKVLSELYLTDMFEQLVQSTPERKDIVGEVMKLHLTAYEQRISENSAVKDTDERHKVPDDFNINDFA